MASSPTQRSLQQEQPTIAVSDSCGFQPPLSETGVVRQHNDLISEPVPESFLDRLPEIILGSGNETFPDPSKTPSNKISLNFKHRHSVSLRHANGGGGERCLK